MRGIDGLDPAVVEVAEEVLPAVFFGPVQLDWRERAADDACRWIVVDGAAEARIGGRSMLYNWPAVVRACHSLVDFFRDPADVVDEQPAGFRLHGEREWIAQAERPDRAILAGGLGKE